MGRLFLLLALLAAGGWYLYDTCCHMDQVVGDSYNTDRVMELIENLEAPAAGGDK